MNAAVRRASVLMVAALCLATVTVVVGPPAIAKGYDVCDPGVTTVTWDGSADDPTGETGDGYSWDDAWNWDENCIPGELDPDTPKNDIAVIPFGESVTLTGVQLQPSIASLQNAGTLTMTLGSELTISGNSTSYITEMYGWLRGSGVFTVTERLDWGSVNGTATMSTRKCFDAGPCVTAPAKAGVTKIAPNAVMNVNGLGVNLSDRRVIKNYGTVALSGNGYIAADYGTTFRNIDNAHPSQPIFDLQNDLGYYQGFTTVPGETLGVFRNSGILRKSAGSGTSVVDVRYFTTDGASPSTGTVEIQTGQLTLLSPNYVGAVTAEVTQGAGFANGAPGPCDPDPDPSDCALDTTADDQQAASLDLTEAGAGTAPVTLEELASAPNPSGFGVPVLVESPGASASNAEPMELRLYLDSSLLGAATASDVAKRARVQRQATENGSYQALPRCAAVGGSTPTQACVDRAASVAETAAADGGDVVLVVETQQNSRYRVGRIPIAS